jgi:hypothetical protein
MKLLDQVSVASPCPASWEDMKGDDKTRHCSLCRLNVHNLSAMTNEEAEALLKGKEGRLCIRYYRREDGTIMTKDCPRGLRALRQKAAKRMVLAAAFVLSAIGCGSHGEKIKAAFGLDKFQRQVTNEMGDMIVVPPISSKPSSSKP